VIFKDAYMKKVLFITSGLGFGGAEKMLIFVADSLCSRGYRVSIVNFNSVPAYVNQYKRIINENIKVYELMGFFPSLA
jgi:hypothetical protein